MSSAVAQEPAKPVPRVMKPSAIPIYGFPVQETPRAPAVETKPNAIESAVRSVREGVEEVVGPIKGVKEATVNFFQTGKAHIQATVGELRDESNSAMRLGFIAGGGLVGYLVGALRGRIVRKLFYSSLGMASVASFCYPKEAKELANEAWVEANKATLIAYNFVQGVQPGSVPPAKAEPSKELVKPTADKETKASSTTVPDPGQSNPADKDLYTTRGSK